MHKFDIRNIGKLDNPKRRKVLPPEETLIRFGVEDKGIFLDVGCGTGYFTIPAAGMLKKHKAVGIDIMPEILEVAKEKAKGINNIEFKKSEEYIFPVADKSVNYVLISNVIHEVADRIRYLQEAERVKKETGYLLIIDWEKKEMEMGPPLHERISREEMKYLCSEAGFEFVEEIDIFNTYYGLKFK